MSTSESNNKKQIRVAVLQSLSVQTGNPFKGFDNYQCTPAHYFDAQTSPYVFDFIQLRKESSYATLRKEVASGKYDVFFNLCDGALDEERAGEDVVRALERLNVPFTGSDTRHYEIAKPDMKMIAHYYEINVAGHCHLTELPTRPEFENMIKNLSFPLLVKHPSGYGSCGMLKNNKCDDIESLWDVTQDFVAKHQCAMIEEFISGDEATVFAVETPSGGVEVLNPILVNFPSGEEFKHFDIKWKDFDGMEWVPIAITDPAREEIMRIGSIAFSKILGGIGTGRCDLRIDRKTNKVYFLEINSNCGMFYPPGSEGSADWIMRMDPKIKHTDVATFMIESALARHAARQRPYKVRFEKMKGYHLVAACNIRKGSIVFDDEGKEFRLVTRPFVEKNWSTEDKDCFSRYAWPISSDRHAYAIWSDDYSAWRPINHSCEPNVVFGPQHSLNCVAYRDIMIGDELTMDYATLCDSEMKPFECACGSSKCRKQIRYDAAISGQYNENRWVRW